MKLEFSREIFLKTDISSFTKVRPAGADGQTDMKPIVAFRNFANARKN
jgi:hypothetical protein